MATLTRTQAAGSVARTSRGALVVALSLPFLLTHVRYQPGVSLPGGLDVETSDLAIGAVVVAAALEPRRRLGAALRAGRAVYAAIAALLGWIGFGLVVPVLAGREYDLGTRIVSAAGFAEYAALALAVPVLVRSRADVVLVLGALTAWTGVAAAVGLVQFLGVDILEASPRGHRQPSIIGYHDFATVSGATAALGYAGVALRSLALPARLSGTAVVLGLLGLSLSGSVSGGAGIGAAALLVLAVAARRRDLTLRRAAVLVAALGLATATTVAVRGGDIVQFTRFLGLREQTKSTREDIQSYSHRTLLVYLGLRVFADHPVAGVGWQATNDYETLEPYLDDAHARFDSIAEEAFPSPAEPFGIQNAWLQALADLGAVGLALFLVALALPVALGTRLGLRACPGSATLGLAGAGMLLVVAGIWTAQGLVATLPADAVMWLAVGVVGAARLGTGESDA